MTKLLVIVGETASGKTALAIDLAERFNGEIIAADSRTVYKDMDIGTAKPTAEEQKRVRHHLIDVVTPDQTFTAGEFQRRAKAAIEDITARSKLPIMVGGTGLYIDSVLYDFTFRPVADPKVRRGLEAMDVTHLQQLLEERGIDPPTDPQNKRHVIRTLETEGQPSQRQPLRSDTLIIGLKLDREMLKQRITQRVEDMVAAGLVNELKSLAEQYGWDTPALQTPGYKAFRQYLDGKLTLEEAKALFVRSDLQLAKRQRTWFKRNDSIQWLDDPRKAVDLATTFLNN